MSNVPRPAGISRPGTTPGRLPAAAAGPIEIEPVEGGLSKLLKEFEE